MNKNNAIGQMTLPKVLIPSLEAAKSALPIFGGTGPTEQAPTTETSTSTESGQGGEQGSGGGTQEQSNPTEQLTPEQISDLVKQVSTLSETSRKLEEELGGYKQKEEETKRAALGREEALAQDLEAAQQAVAALDEVVRYVALVNAIQNNSDLEFHDVNFVMSKLDPESFELEVDLENKRANVSGIENELKRIAKENDWAVKKNSIPGQQQRQNTPSSRQRGSGAPPVNPTVNQAASTRRKELESKWPVIASGRSPIRT